MLEKPDLQDDIIIAILQQSYGLSVEQVAFLPLGADVNTAVYRIITTDQKSYFLKLRRGRFDETSVALPKFLSDLGIAHFIPPLLTKTGKLWGDIDQFKTIMYPFVTGHNGYETDMSDRHWRELGTALRRIHTASMPAVLTNQIRRETYSPRERMMVKDVLAGINDNNFEDATAAKMANLMRARQATILDLIHRAEKLALKLKAQPPEITVCHSDIHAGNILIGTDGALYIVDWDEAIIAPKERDLMYIGGGLMASGLTPQEEEVLFYPAYGHTQINFTAMAYYRYERIIQDIAAFCKQLLFTDDGGQDREQSLQYVESNFWPNSTIDIAYQSDMS